MKNQMDIDQPCANPFQPEKRMEMAHSVPRMDTRVWF